MSPGADERAGAGGLYVQIYPSTLESASRMLRIGRSLHQGLGFARTELVGVQGAGLPAREGVADGVDLVRLTGSARTGNLGRVLRAALWQPRVFLAYRRRRIAVVACHNVWILPMCWLLARASGARLVYNPHELETETYTMRGLKKAAAKLIETLLVPRCDLVSAVNEPIARWYADRYSIPLPVVVGNVPVVREADVGLRARLGVDRADLLYIHTGHLAEGRHIPDILRAFSSSPHHLVFLGDGPLRPDVVRAARAHARIHWLPPVDPDLVVAHVREADVGLCLIEAQLDLSKRLSSPNKLTEALAAHTPALCTDLAEVRRVLGDWADTWVLSDIGELGAALERITAADVAAFRARWTGIVDWSTEVRPLVEAYGRVLATRSTPSNVPPE